MASVAFVPPLRACARTLSPLDAAAGPAGRDRKREGAGVATGTTQNEPRPLSRDPGIRSGGATAVVLLLAWHPDYFTLHRLKVLALQGVQLPGRL